MRQVADSPDCSSRDLRRLLFLKQNDRGLEFLGKIEPKVEFWVNLLEGAVHVGYELQTAVLAR